MSDSTPETPLPPTKPKRQREKLESIHEVRRAFARTLQKLERSVKHPGEPGVMPVEHARALIYGYSKLAELIRAGSADEVLLRLAALERRQVESDEQKAQHEPRVPH